MTLTFNAALFTEERKQNLEIGDLVPAILLNQSRNQAILFWEKGNGNILYIDIKSQVQDDGTLRWYVSGPAIEIAK